MLIHVLLVTHIVVLGYWLGSELVINSDFRYVCFRHSLPTAERDRFMDQIMHTDQHVRYALVLQLGLGFTLAFLLGHLPGGTSAAWLAGGFAVVMLCLVEVTHQLRKQASGKKIAGIDRGVRYSLMMILAGLAVASLAGKTALPSWLAWKLLCFVGVMACGVGIRLSMLRLAPTWAKFLESGSDPEVELGIRKTYFQATSILVLLWVFIALIVWLSIWKPA
jgi:hypothetical protein